MERRIAIEGEVTIFAAGALRERLLEAIQGGTDVEADLAGVTEMDTAGVQLLLAAMKEAAARGKHLRFTNASGAALDILNLCGLGDCLAAAQAPVTGEPA